MKVRELIEFLQRYNPEAEVCLIDSSIPCAGGYCMPRDGANFETPKEYFATATRVDLQPSRETDLKQALTNLLSEYE